MPSIDPAACANADAPMTEGVARAALLEVRVRGVPKTLFLGGLASASFPEKTQAQLAGLLPGERFSVTWRDAVFHGVDDMLGAITAKILSPGTTSSSTGTVTSLSAAGGVSEAVAGADFFPAVNRNEFDFEISIPRFGLTMRSETPVVNAATIKEIPPVGSVYELESSVMFRSVDGGFLASVLGPVEITACNVKLLVNGGIEANILSTTEDGDEVEIEVAVENVTDYSELDVTWMIWPRPPAAFEHPKGSISLRGQEQQRLRFRALKDMFYEARWVAFASAKPFEASASTAVRVPGLT